MSAYIVVWDSQEHVVEADCFGSAVATWQKWLHATALGDGDWDDPDAALTEEPEEVRKISDGDVIR